MFIKTLTRLSLGAAVIALAVPAAAQTAPAASAKPAAAPQFGSFGFDLSARDTSVKPGDDFWRYANGTWEKNTQIAPDRQTAGPSTMLADQAEAQVKAILDDAAKNPTTMGANGKKVGDLYASYMDEAAIEKAGIAPLKPYFAKIDAANDKAKLQTLFTQPGYASPVGMGPLPNPSNPTMYTIGVGQGGLSMPKDYYLKEGEKFDGFRKAYRAYIAQILTLGGIAKDPADAAARADLIFALETEMAKVHWSPEESRNLQKMLVPMDAAQRKALAPEFDWEGMLKASGYGAYPVVIMSQSTALTGLGKLFAATPVATWQDWIKYNFVSGNAGVLPKAIDDARFAFFGKTLSGQPAQRARWKRGVAVVNGVMGEAVGEIYVKRHYPPESQAQMAELINNLIAAYRERITANTWMDAATKEKALAKLAAFDPMIGYPSKWIDYTPLVIKRGQPLANAMAAGEFQEQLQLSRLPKPVDKKLWIMTPQTVNAYYSPLTNQIVFPAAILQPPMFNPKADPAINYGAIGGVIGHEIGHGFDDQGSQFGPTGKFENWWTPEARTAFAKQTGVLVDQYNQYEPIPGTKVNGKLTLGENIGDLGGVETAYAAYQKYQEKHGKAPVIDGLTGDQRFFLGWAQAWRKKTREDAERANLLTDPHSPAYYRTNGIVRNVDAWYAAFDVKPGDKLYLPPEQRVRIW